MIWNDASWLALNGTGQQQRLRTFICSTITVGADPVFLIIILYPLSVNGLYPHQIAFLSVRKCDNSFSVTWIRLTYCAPSLGCTHELFLYAAISFYDVQFGCSKMTRVCVGQISISRDAFEVASLVESRWLICCSFILNRNTLKNRP